MWTTTSLASSLVPVKDGVGSLDRDGGTFKVTVGAAVSTVNVRASLEPVGFPIELSCMATAVYVCFPFASAGCALPEIQLPPAGVAVAVATTEPAALPPA